MRANPASIAAVASVLPATADPAAPQDVSVANPVAALTARADAASAFQGLFLALGAVALLVGGIGIANVMVIAVLERRSEIGLRRALGARRLHVAVQFAAEATLLAGCGGVAGAVLGGFSTTVYAAARHWDAVVPVPVLLAAVAVALLVGAAAASIPRCAPRGWSRPRRCGSARGGPGRLAGLAGHIISPASAVTSSRRPRRSHHLAGLGGHIISSVNGSRTVLSSV